MNVPVNENVPINIRGCVCRECGLIAPTWFHKDFLLGDGFTCIWCAFSHRPDLIPYPKPTDWEYVT